MTEKTSEKLILVVEDDPDGREVVGRLLKFQRIPYVATGSAEEAIEAMETNSFTAGIFDLSLPGMDGWSLLARVRKSPETRHMPCAAMTAYHSAEVAMKAIEAGFVAYFPKPLESTSFVREIERVFSET